MHLVLIISLIILLLIKRRVANPYQEGLNKWTFLSSEGHELYSDLLCPNPMVGAENRVMSGSSKYNATGVVVRDDGERLDVPVANDIWALKTTSEISFLPCDLRPITSLLRGNKPLQYASNAAATTVENRILFMNMSFRPFDFDGANAKICSKFIKLQFDEEEGVELSCSSQHDAMTNHIHWSTNGQKKKQVFVIFRNLERFLQNEENMRRRIYFQLFFTSANGQRKECILQQYELNLPNSGCNFRKPPRIEDVCGLFNCDQLIFPFYEDESHRNLILKGGGKEQEDANNAIIADGRNSTQFINFKLMDVRLIVFLTVVPIVLIGMLIFALEIIVYITCLRRSRNPMDSDGGTRSQQILQNSLNLWETIPNREGRSVSFCPVATSIDLLPGSESPATVSTPRVLKSALKKSTENLPPPPASFFETDREYPPSYHEIMKH